MQQLSVSTAGSHPLLLALLRDELHIGCSSPLFEILCGSELQGYESLAVFFFLQKQTAAEQVAILAREVGGRVKSSFSDTVTLASLCLISIVLG